MTGPLFMTYLAVVLAGITLRAADMALSAWQMKRLEERMRKSINEAAVASLTKAYREDRAARAVSN